MHYLVVAVTADFAANRLFVRCGVPVPCDKALAESCFRCRLYTAPASGFGKGAGTSVQLTDSLTIDIGTRDF